MNAAPQDLPSLPSASALWAAHPLAPFPSFTRTLSLPATFSFPPSYTASVALFFLNPSSEESNAVQRAKLGAFLESQQAPTETAHYDQFLKRVEDKRVYRVRRDFEWLAQGEEGEDGDMDLEQEGDYGAGIRGAGARTDCAFTGDVGQAEPHEDEEGDSRKWNWTD